MTMVKQWELRAAFARRLSDLYGTEVPAYTTLLEVAQEVNRDFQLRHPDLAERLGSLERVSAERHGAIRVGSTKEMAEVARIFGAVGMSPVGFYDLRDAKPTPVPVVSTAFRPIDRSELARNPFRVFTSMLVPEDRRFFNEELENRLKTFIGERTLFSDELLSIADQATVDKGLNESDAERFLSLATSAFALSEEPVDRQWYSELDAISSVAADIGGVSSTHINHLTPRVLDIDDLYARMEQRGVKMIDSIQGPPRWSGPEVLLRQTSFRALSEPRKFREKDGSVSEGELRVRFGEVEARGIALTPRGRDHYDHMVAAVDERQLATGRPRADVAEEVWNEKCPPTERELLARDHGFFTFHITGKEVTDELPVDLMGLLDGGWLEAAPIVYEDFLPRSAAGIFASNLSSEGTMDVSHGGAARDMEWLAGHMDVEIRDSARIYAAERDESLAQALAVLKLESIVVPWDDLYL